ncbi:MAG: hypothetical protein KME46_16455 [Brasilonema angustatum HA4187-MV1]|nr:hypothetical protein [Brasilonema angustatum HA4187-MV1]
MTTVSVFLAELLGKKENTVRQQLREWYRDGEDKTKTGRATLDITSCFSPLLCWILSQRPENEKRLALAADASTHERSPVYTSTSSACCPELRSGDSRSESGIGRTL